MRRFLDWLGANPRDALACVALVSIGTGCVMLSLPLALIVVGSIVLVMAVAGHLLQRHYDHADEDEEQPARFHGYTYTEDDGEGETANV